MTRFILSFLLLFAAVTAHCQQTATYVVRRGETMESIAAMLRVDVAELRALNADAELFFTGMTITVPVSPQVVGMKNGVAVLADSTMDCLTAYTDACRVAGDAYKKGQFAEARRLFQDVLTTYGGKLACGDALYGRALSVYRMGKWKQAQLYLEIVAEEELCTEPQRNTSLALLAKIRQEQGRREQEREQRRERRAAFWQNFGQALAQGAQQVVAAYAGASGYSFQTYGNSQLLNPQLAIAQTQAQYAQWGSVQVPTVQFSFPPINWEHVDWSQMTTDTFSNFRPDFGSITSTGSGSYSEQNTTSGTTQQSQHTCPLCKGNRRIVHDSYVYVYGTSDYKERCNECGGYFLRSTGHSHITCPQCHGKGYFTTS